MGYTYAYVSGGNDALPLMTACREHISPVIKEHIKHIGFHGEIL
jgi:hypothetical protein